MFSFKDLSCSADNVSDLDIKGMMLVRGDNRRRYSISTDFTPGYSLAQVFKHYIGPTLCEDIEDQINLRAAISTQHADHIRVTHVPHGGKFL